MPESLPPTPRLVQFDAHFLFVFSFCSFYWFSCRVIRRNSGRNCWRNFFFFFLRKFGNFLKNIQLWPQEADCEDSGRKWKKAMALDGCWMVVSTAGSLLPDQLSYAPVFSQFRPVPERTVGRIRIPAVANRPLNPVALHIRRCVRVCRPCAC